MLATSPAPTAHASVASVNLKGPHSVGHAVSTRGFAPPGAAPVRADLPALVRAAGAFVRDPSPPNYFAFDRVFVVLTPGAAETAFVAAVRSNAVLARLLDDRYRPRRYTLDDLAACAPGTLGEAYRRHMLRYGLSPEFFPPHADGDDFHYFRARSFETHDIVHAALGFGSDVKGEMGVIGYTLGQMHRHTGMAGGFAMAAAYGGILGALYMASAMLSGPGALLSYATSFARGYRIGYDAAPLGLLEWEEHLDEPLDALRARLQIIPAT